jgi:hypothetical protein
MNILAPISAGELIDKITILRIKRDKIRDDASQRRVRHELDQLVQVRNQRELNTSALAALEEQLFEINLRLWQVEDDLRESERTSNFGVRFVELARLVYKLNDRRAALKKEINAVTGSVITEEKSYTPYE